MKKFTMGVVVGAVIAFSVSAYADDIAQLIGKQVDNEYPVVLNGTKLNNAAPSIDGTSYAPVREISEKLGLNVKFENETVILSNKQEVTTKVPSTPSTEENNADKIKAIDAQIYEIDLMVQFLKRDNEIAQSIIDSAKPESNVDKHKQDIIANKAKIAELEKQKAELEKQKAELTK